MSSLAFGSRSVFGIARVASRATPRTCVAGGGGIADGDHNDEPLAMLRLADLKLSLDHTDDDLTSAVLERLRIGPQDLRGYSIFRRAIDARKRSAISLIYALEI